MRMRTLPLLLATGCGGGTSGGTHTTTTAAAPGGDGAAGKPATHVLADSKRAGQAAEPVHLTGHVISGGQTVGVDLTIAGSRGSKGTMTLGGLGISLVRVGPKVSIRGTDAFWRHFGGGPAVAFLHGRWLADLNGSLYVAATGTPYPFALVIPKGADRGNVTFDHRNETVTVTAPKNAIDLSALTGSG